MKRLRHGLHVFKSRLSVNRCAGGDRAQVVNSVFVLVLLQLHKLVRNRPAGHSVGGSAVPLACATSPPPTRPGSLSYLGISRTVDLRQHSIVEYHTFTIWRSPQQSILYTIQPSQERPHFSVKSVKSQTCRHLVHCQFKTETPAKSRGQHVMA